ncbi:transcriptional regulator, IclR family [Gemmobacter megaterium]|uniref:Transcriptional regulator, IclR family n=1 Tax=Gemmobacter megaterium TaxID=1086013 RepID=A0A1N7KGJ4_9RHOB|nr:IclR family transcriptional regulator [Gemmobacter megaterium]GGE02053.1 IclR family transcriptional regulator [Gemmobacter megaterium]SIS60726.1 transcriptional regulator, IclR family [Gemmobacter megaterium]
MLNETPKAKRNDPLMVQSVAKAFRVLTVFDKGHGSLTLSQIAQLTDMDVSTAQRFTHTLTQLGYLRKDPVTRQFELSIKTLDLAYHYIRGSRLVDRAMPVLLHLSKETEEAVSLTVLDGTEIVFVSRYLSRRMLNTDVISGSRLPAYCTAPGRAILSRLPDAAVREILAQSDLLAHTPATPTDIDEILARIAEARRNGYAAAFDEIYHGDASVAAPIIGASGEVVGAVSMAVPLARMERAQFLETFPHLVTAAARGISF